MLFIRKKLYEWKEENVCNKLNYNWMNVDNNFIKVLVHSYETKIVKSRLLQVLNSF